MLLLYVWVCCLATLIMIRFFFPHFVLVYQLFIFIFLRLEYTNKSSILSTWEYGVSSPFSCFLFTLDILPFLCLLLHSLFTSWMYGWPTFHYWPHDMYSSANSLAWEFHPFPHPHYFCAYNSHIYRTDWSRPGFQFQVACLKFSNSLLWKLHNINISKTECVVFNFTHFFFLLPPAFSQ